MEYTLFLARALGLFLTITAAAILANRKNMRLIFHSFVHEDVPFFSGFFLVALGIVLVLTYNRWDTNLQIMISLVGWTTLLKGIIRLLFPKFVVDVVKELKKGSTVTVMLLVLLGLGMYFLWNGFFI